jgi:hypothetical protein
MSKTGRYGSMKNRSGGYGDPIRSAWHHAARFVLHTGGVGGRFRHGTATKSCGLAPFFGVFPGVGLAGFVCLANGARSRTLRIAASASAGVVYVFAEVAMTALLSERKKPGR